MGSSIVDGGSWSLRAPQRLTTDLARHDPHRPALLAPGRPVLSYGALLREIERNVDALAAAGLGQGHRVAVAMPSGPELAALLLALIDCTTAVPLHPETDAATCRHLLAAMRIDALIVPAGAQTPAVGVARELGATVGHASFTPTDPAGVLTLTFEGERRAVAARAPDPATVSLLLHTSGTTALPKRVPQSSRHLRAMAQARARRTGLVASDRSLCVSPLYTGSGIRRNLLPTLWAGASMICAGRFVADEFFAWLRESQPTFYTGNPTIHRAVLDLVERHGRPAHSLRFAMSTSAPLPDAMHERYEALMGVPLLQAYAMTEGGAIAEAPPPPGIRRVGTVGVAAGNEIAIADADGRHLASGETGEVLVRGPEVFEGYEGDPAATAAAFCDGWFRTGDLGWLDADGFLHLCGRVKELINRGGFKVSPQEVDAALLRHAAVADAATFGAPHPTLGEDVVALVTLRTPGAATESELRGWALSQLTAFKVPSRVVAVAAIPRSPLGKLQRRELAALYAASSGVTYVAPSGAHETLVAQTFADVLGRPAVGAQDNFFDLGGDSLRAAQVLVRINAKLGLDLEPALLFLLPVVAEFSAALGDAHAAPGTEAEPIAPRRRGTAAAEERR